MDCSEIPDTISELSVLFTDDTAIRELNHTYRGKDRPTDVLSFSQLEDESTLFSGESLGDIVISLERAREQASDYDNDFDQEISRLLIHGLLHLFGYDHENVSEAEIIRMQQEEDRLANKHLVAPGYFFNRPDS